MKSKLSQRIELLANLAIIIIAILLGYFLIQRFFFQPNTVQIPTEIAKGAKISLPDIDWKANQKTLLLVLQKGCKFCTESMPFYKTLMQKAKEKGVKLIAVLPNSREESQQYLKENGVEIQEIKQSQLNSINVPLSPTLILINEKGEVEYAWIGKLSSGRETEVIENL